MSQLTIALNIVRFVIIVDDVVAVVHDVVFVIGSIALVVFVYCDDIVHVVVNIVDILLVTVVDVVTKILLEVKKHRIIVTKCTMCSCYSTFHQRRSLYVETYAMVFFSKRLIIAIFYESI